MDLLQAARNLPPNAKLLINNPVELIKQQKRKKSYIDAVVVLLVLSVFTITWELIDSVFLPQSPSIFPQEIHTIIFIIGLVLLPAGFVFACFVITLVEFIFIKVFRGQCDLEELFYLIAVVFWPATFVWGHFISVMLLLFDSVTNMPSYSNRIP
jgi:hypothetical protein